MTKVHIPELRFHPVPAVKSRFQIHRLDFFATRREAHATAPVPAQFIDIQRLGRFRRPTGVRAPSQSCRCADRQPVRRLITSPPMLFGVDEALQQPGLETVAVREVLSHLLLAQAQNPAGKILAAHLRPDEKAGHID